jgi:uncharacterized protein
MKFRLEDIPEEGLEANFSEAQDWLDERLHGEEKRLFRIIGPIRVHLRLSRSGRMIHVKSRLETRLELHCARCLEPFFLGLNSEFGTVLKPRPNFPLAEEREFNREDLESDFYDGEEVNLTPFVQDQVLLTLPQKALCREECRGLCPRCGKNLNRDVCQCPAAVMDPRFQALKNLKVQ